MMMSDDKRFPYAARAYTTEIQIREADTDGRTLFGRVVPYGEVATVNDGQGPYRETFAPGAFSRSIDQNGDKVRLYTQHNRSRLPIGRAVDFQETDGGLDASFRVADTADGNDALTLVREGVVGSFSVGFRGIDARTEDGVTVRTEAALLETSLVADPAYAGAAVAGIRSAWPDEQELAEWLESIDEHTRQLIADTLAADGTGVVEEIPEVASPQTARHDPRYAEALMRVRNF